MKKPTHTGQVGSYARRLLYWSVTALLLLSTANVYPDEPLECVIEPHVLVDVSSSEIGVIESVDVDEADVVRKGESVATLHADVERAAFAVTRARSEAASEIELLLHDHDFNTRRRDRIEQMYKQNAVSTQEVDEARSAQDAAWLRLQAAMEKQRTTELEATRDKLALARRTVHSPIEGVVVLRHKSAGEFVDGDPIVQLAQLDPLRIRVVVPITMFGQIQAGMQATVTPELPVDGPFLATVTSIDPLMDAATATLGVRLSLPNPEHRLPPGLKCTLVLHEMETESQEIENYASETVSGSSSGAQEFQSSETDLQLGAATIRTPDTHELSAVSPVTLQNQVTIGNNDMANDMAELATAESGLRSESSCIALGPLPSVDVIDTVSDVLNAGDMHFVRRHVRALSNGHPKIQTWLDVEVDSSKAIHAALLVSLKRYYPVLSELPIDCAQVSSR